MKYVLMGLIRLYQIVLSPVVNWRGPVCKFEPSCSHYGYEAVKTHGAIKGGGMTVWRVLRCNPWSSGGYDPVKPREPRGPEGDEDDSQARNLSESETSSPGETTQTSDRTEMVGLPTKPARDAVRPDLMSSRGARS
ncbi:membrane protein insertion efficiency factor YidD [Catenulispora sp. NF23]|uniref:Putative membrane protein insertion efficiency factor n=1 Tax=Catenulispora pinistramenti TaxID=2705254 RepID=A0ABS5KX86_9ACTN|nr:membrane protein insertion efficiency factor YidD [Catenulispora pinistramenti]MBS2534057.1 membrane protein insertion efficiency factor YidD [Catenulispora pinistramenti]MBS2550677.1 membrane protein insertion efficiency factor YidD [Catenulispora pinistramenti]